MTEQRNQNVERNIVEDLQNKITRIDEQIQLLQSKRTILEIQLRNTKRNQEK